MKAVVKNRTIRILILIEVIYGVLGIILWVRPMKSYSCTAMEDYDFAGGTGVFIEDFACAEDPGIYIDNSLLCQRTAPSRLIRRKPLCRPDPIR